MLVFNNLTLFRYKDGYALEESSRQISAEIGKQIPDSAGTRALESTTEVADSVMTWCFIFSALINIVLSNLGSMEYTLTMINSLQMIVHLPILNIIIPGNVMMFMQIVLPIVMFDILEPLESMGISIDFLFSFDVEARTNTSEEILHQMRELGYQTHNSVLNLSALSVAILVYFLRLFVLGVVFCVYLLKNRTFGRDFIEK